MPPAPPLSPQFSDAARALRVAGLVLLGVGGFFGVAGVFLLALTFRLYTTQQDILAHAERATGTIVDFKQSWSSDGKSRKRTLRFAPVFTFTDYADASRRVTSRVSRGGKPGYQIGQTVPVLYHHDRPEEAELDTFFASWGGALICGGLGSAFFLVGVLLVSLGVRRLLRPGRFLETADGGNARRDPAILSGP